MTDKAIANVATGAASACPTYALDALLDRIADLAEARPIDIALAGISQRLGGVRLVLLFEALAELMLVAGANYTLTEQASAVLTSGLVGAFVAIHVDEA